VSGPGGESPDMWSQFGSIIQGLATVVIAVAGLTIAAQQKRLADIRLRNDLFDRRFKVYEATRTFLVEVSNKQLYGDSIFFAFIAGTNEAALLFGKDVVGYISEVSDNAVKMKLQKLRYNETQDHEALDAAYTLNKWCANQITEGVLLQRFKPEMGWNLQNQTYGLSG
jgi:hypothetical protein